MRIERNTDLQADLEFAPRRRALDVAPETRCIANVTLYPHLAALTVNGIPIAVSPKEFALARTLFEHAGEVVAHERCFAALGGAAGLKSARLLRVYIFALRQKLRGAGAMTDLATVRGRGYVLREPPAADRPVCTLRYT
ncbi:MAG TPA: winged helix-turn-helix domain-containing protein [Candidatus Eremiobacteraceae bacterium]|jgi:DNA-binding response OmpR family regulator